MNLINRLQGRDWLGYIVSLPLVGAATLIRAVFVRVLDLRAPFLVFYPAVMLTALIGGFRAGLLATVLSALSASFFIDSVGDPLSIHERADWVALALFVAGGAMMSWIAAATRRAQAQAAQSEAQMQVAERELQAATALQEQRAILDSIVKATDVMLVYLDPGFNFVTVNQAYADACKMRPEDMIGKNHFALYPHEENEAIFRRVRNTGEPVFYKDKPFVFPDQPERGVTFWDWSLVPVKSEAGGVAGLVFSLRETTKYKQAEDALQQRREWLRVTLTSIGDAVLAVDTAGRITFVNPVAAALTGWTEEAAYGRPTGEVLRLINEETREPAEDIVRRVVREGRVIAMANHTALISRDGREIPVEDSAAPIVGKAGEIAGAVLVFHDVTEKRRAQAALQQSERRVRLKLQSILSPEGDIGALDLGDVIDSPEIQSFMEDFYRLARLPMAIIGLNGEVLVGVGWQDICTKFHRVNPESCRNCIESDTELTAGVPEGEFKLYRCKNHMWDAATPLVIGGKHVGNIFTGQFFLEDEPLERDLFRAQARKFGFEESAYLTALEKVPRVSKDSVTAGMAFLSKLGKTLSLLSYSNIKLARSLSERERTEDALLQASDQRRLALEAAELGAWDYQFQTHELLLDEKCAAIFGLRPGAVPQSGVLERIHPDDRAAVRQSLDAALAGANGGAYHGEFRIVRSGGAERWVTSHGRVFFEGEQRRPARFVGVNMDITEHRRDEEALRQSQKLESIGLLAAGIAHDFNNLLVGVVGNASLAKQMISTDNPVSELLDSIEQSGEHAAHLTRQMLAYSGQGRFIVEPHDLSALARETCGLVKTSIPPQVTLRFDLPAALPPVEADRAQIQQVFMNLVLNAAEAIGNNQGEVSVSTGIREVDEAFIRNRVEAADLRPGQFVFLEVRDTGCGMDSATRARIFDPFFSTKFTGRGLGLAAVAGIVRGHRGAILVSSAPGSGSCFTVLFPAAGRIATPTLEMSSELRLDGEGTVLVVDDEDLVRGLAKKVLERNGYTVLEADSGASAIEIAKQHPGDIAAILLDLSMPGLSGADAMQQMREARPSVKVLVSSGYAEEEAMRLFQGQPVSGFIQKPYTSTALAEKVKSVIGPCPGGRASSAVSGQ
jgi:PAS domain S-box-containing protein